ncbi:MAG: periplasmic protein TonB [Blastocatellia bacterium]|jgi:TonB family protein|nr:periplasmic protein TonB [Blastocatellia bacterium]
MDYVSAGIIRDDYLLLKPEPTYPEIARAKGISGIVFVFVVFDVDGSASSAQVSSGPPLLQKAALEAARQARISITKMSGVPIKVGGLVRYEFSLNALRCSRT